MSHESRLDPRADEGVTLIEVLITIVISGILFAGLLGGLAGMIKSSALHRRQADGSWVLFEANGLEASIELVSIGEGETKLDYRGHLDVRHRMASRMRGLFNEIAEDHAHSLVHRVKVKAEQRRLAQERLLK